jgi:hypothetical protein
MLINAELATANMVMNPNRPTGNDGAPACTTFSNGASPSPSSSGATSAMAEIDTST